MNFTHLAAYIKNHAQTNPTDIAIKSDQTVLNYRELEAQSNRITNFLNEKIFRHSSGGSGENLNVCVILDRSAGIITTIIGLLKAGLVFVPVSPHIPTKRVELLLKETKTRWIITSLEYYKRFQHLFERNNQWNVLLIDGVPGSGLPPAAHALNDNHGNSEPDFQMRYNKYCYIYFTSGTAGIPKGVLGRHKSLHHYIDWEINEFGIDSQFQVSQLTPPTFDPYLRDIFVPLLAGGTICIPDYNTLMNPRKLITWINENKIRLIHIVPSLFKLISHEIRSSDNFSDLEYILLAGELLRGNDVRKFIEIFNHRIQLVNIYGPTETTLAKFFYRIQPPDVEKSIVPVGKTIKEAEVLVLDEQGQKCLTGNIGEIYIRTPYISSGYFNNKALNKDVFIKNPFSDDKNDIIYKTGDMGRLLFDGNVELTGRLDGQVKIRGNRVETGEIENLLLNVNYIKEAVVVDKEDQNGEKYLCAFLVLENGSYQKNLADTNQLKRFLAEHLPAHMLPSYFIPLDAMPLTPNGKVDRKALPKPDASAFQPCIYTPPRNEVEKKLVEIWNDVLNIPHGSIGIDDVFFDIGGHSLKAIVMVSKIHEQLNVQVPVAEIFKKSTIRDLAEYISVKEEENYESIPPVEQKEYYVLSSAQKRLYFLQQMEPRNTAYNIPVFISLWEDINLKKLYDVFKRLIAHHDNLRTSFHMVNDAPVQRIHEQVEFEIENIDFTKGNIKSFIRPFDLSQAPLMRVGLLRTREKGNHLLVDVHHIITDGVSQWVLRRNFMSLYEGEILPPLRIQYKDFVKWQNSNKKKDKLEQQEVYWLKEFEGEIPVLNLPTDFPRPTLQGFEGNTIYFEINREITYSIMEYVQEKEVTLYMLLLAVTNILLSKLSGQEDIVIGAPAAGRTHADLEKIIGMFVNTLALRNYPIGEKTSSGFLQELKQGTLDAFENQEYQFEDLVGKVAVNRDMGRNPLFDVILVLQNMDRSMGDGFDNKIVDKPVPYPREYRDNINRISKLDLTITAWEIGQGLKISFQYCTKLFKIGTVQRFMVYFKQILLKILENPQSKVGEIEIITREEKSRILYDLNNYAAHYPEDKTIHQLFEKQTQRTPGHIAAVYSSLQITYRELNDRAGRLAQDLRKKGVMPEVIVGINMKRSAEMIIGIMGILKAGGAYLPIDPDHPKERRDLILEDSAAQLLVTTSNLNEGDKKIKSREDKKNTGTVLLDPFDFSKFSLSHRPIGSSSHPSDLAYIIYTSGTTGIPKGVPVEHRNVVRLMINDKFQFDFGNGDVWTMFHSFNFDFSVWEMYGALLYGGKLIIVPKMVSRDPGEFLGLLKREQVTVLNQTPSAFYNLLQEEIKSSQKELNIRYVIFGGEALKPVKLKKWKEKYPDTTLVNMFGITETTVHVTYKEIGDNEINFNISNIGIPIPTMTTYVVDRHLNLLPLGVAGELLVGWEGVARGYLNRPELTAERFISNLFKENERIYRSGDRARFLPDSELEYLGRIDHQVQLKGFRIELGEIENRLLQFDGITEAVVTAKESNDGDYMYLCAYIVSQQDIDITALREYMTQKLPDYMIPRNFVRLEKIPLTPNGKIDRAALPEPGINVGVEGIYTIPVDKTQEKLVEIWQQVLQVEPVGIKDNYFHLGGDSIKAIALVSVINNAFQSNLKIADLYMNQTVEELALLVKEDYNQQEDGLAEHLLKIEDLKNRVYKIADNPGNIEDVFPMSDIEKGMMFHTMKDAELEVYNNQNWYQMVVEDFDIERLKKAFSLMMEKHPILRTAYIAGEFAHVVYKNVSVDIPCCDLSGMDVREQEAFITRHMVESRNKPFDVQVPPLWRMSIFNLGIRNTLIMLWEVHHAIIDGWSNALLLPELYNTYRELKQDPGFVPQKLKSGYKEYILQQMEDKRDPKTTNYWKNELSGYKRLVFPQPMEIKTGKNKPKAEIKTISINLGVERRKRLEKIARKLNTRLKHLCFAANALMLNMFSYENNIVMGLVTNNRPLCEDGDKIIGCFLNTVPIRIKVPELASWSDFIRAVDKKMLELKKYDRLSLLEIVTHLGERTGEQNQLIDTLFNFVDFYAYERGLSKENTKKGSDPLNLERTAKNNFTFSLNIHTTGGSFLASIGYSTTLLGEENLKKMCDYYERILDHFIVEPEGLIDKGKIMSPSEKKKLIDTFNNTGAGFPGDKTIHHLFEQQVEKTPDTTALVGPNPKHGAPFGQINALGLGYLTYREFNEKSNRLALMLRGKGVQPDTIVGIRANRSIEMIVAIFAILKASGAYLPIDPDYPQERTDFMLKDSNGKICLTTEEIAACILSGNSDRGQLNRWKNSHNAAYVIYTSGSTGNPKGVIVEHRSVVNRLNWMQREYPLASGDMLIQKTPFTFDVSVWELFWWSFQGASLCLMAHGDEKSPDAIIETITMNKVTTIHFVPSMLNAFLEYIENWGNLNELSTLNRVFASGEALNVHQVETFNRLLNKNETKLINLYGPTEATVDVSYFQCPRAGKLDRIPIGKPIDNIRLYVLDKAMDIQPVGVTGELSIAGIGLARGYLNQPELTNEKFCLRRPGGTLFEGTRGLAPLLLKGTDKGYIQSYHHASMQSCHHEIMQLPHYHPTQYPTTPSPYHRIYLTGDLAQWQPDGNIEFLGRIDDQVKIRGFRIELGEIESHLLNYNKIKEAVAMLRENTNGDKYICAYIVSDKEFTVSQLRSHLAKSLPDYMLPSYFIPLEKVPLTPNGKVDRKSLPGPKSMDLGSDDVYIGPRNKIEKKLVEVWQKVLGINIVSIKDNFFEIGGDSIKSIQIVSRMKKAGYKVEMKDIFRYPRISELAPLVRKIERIADQSPSIGTTPLTPIQKWFFENQSENRHHFNQAVILYFETGIETEIVKSVFLRLQEHHDALRMIYKKTNEGIVQVNQGLDHPFSLQVFDYRNRKDALSLLANNANEIQASINLEIGPLMKLGLFHLHDGDRLLIVIHHLVIDGVSWRILLEDIDTLYRQYKKGKLLTLPLKTDSFKVWSEKLSQYADSHQFLKEKNYWTQLESKSIPKIKKDFENEDNYMKDVESLSFSLEETETHLLLTKVNEAFGTGINDILLTALGLAVKRTYGNDRLLIALEGHGREEIFDDIDINRTVGWFTSLYPVLLDFSYENEEDPDRNFARQIKEVKENLRQVPHKGVGYGILKYLTAEENKEGINFTLNPQVIFNYLGQFDEDLEHRSFRITKESVGYTRSQNERRDVELEVSGIITTKRFIISLSYNRKQYKSENISRLLEHFKRELIHIITYCSTREVKELTPGDFTYKGLSIEAVERLMGRYPDVEDLYMLTPMQGGMLFHSLHDKHSFAYFEQSSFRVYGDLDVAIFKKSLDELSNRHEVLRTAFIYNGKGIDRPLQLVLKNRQVELYYENICNRGGKNGVVETDAIIESFKRRDRERSFELSEDVLMRVAILQLDSAEYELIWSHHHILMDGWCTGIMITEFFEIYNSYLGKRPYQLPPVKPYRTYIQWLEKQDPKVSGRYWSQYLEGYEEPSVTPQIILQEPGSRSDIGYKNQEVSFTLDSVKNQRLNSLAARNNVTLNTLIQASWGIILGRYSNKQDVVYGAVVSGRPPVIEGVESIVGLFINTIPIRIRWQEKTKFTGLLRQLQQEAVDSEPHHYYPLAEIQSASALKQNLLDHIMIFENYPIADQIEGLVQSSEKKLASLPLEISNVRTFEQTNYNFNIIVLPGKQLNVQFSYNGYIYERDLIERISGHFKQLLLQIIDNDQLDIESFTLLSDEEKKQILYDFNHTDAQYPKDRTIHELFEEQAGRTPGNIAIVFEDIQLTYREIKQGSNQLSYFLKEKGVESDTIIAIMAERSIEMVVGIMGILKAGGAYLPIDPKYPADRVNYMLADSKAKILVSDRKDVGTRHYPVPALDLVHAVHCRTGNQITGTEQCYVPMYSGYSTATCNLRPSLAYIIYTSGTTGKPKGVLVEHRNLLAYITAFFHEFTITSKSNVLQQASFTFDAFVEELYPPLLKGGKVVIASKEEILDIHLLKDLIIKNQVKTISCSPLLLNVLNKSLGSTDQGDKEYIFISGGDVLKGDYFNNLVKIGMVYNTYGPTETTVCVTYFKCSPSSSFTANIPIGKPISNYKVYILAPGCQLQPIGAAGELCVAGDGVTRGYLNRPELTAEKFDHDLMDYQDDQDKRKKVPAKKNHMSHMSHMSYISYLSYKLYKTGDLARWLPDGNIEFLDRIDQQVKVRGFRIELGEIENRLLNHKQIKEVVVLAKARTREMGKKIPSADKYLCAYYVLLDPDAVDIDTSGLKGYLSAQLPDYMIPSYFIRVKKIPITPNGKINRNALLKLEESRPKSGDTPILPGNKLEKTIAQAWKEVLHLDEVGINENFFDLGGNSLTYITLNYRLNEMFAKHIPVVDMYKYPTIRSFSQYLIRGGMIEDVSSIDKDISAKKDRAERSRRTQRARRKN